MRRELPGGPLGTGRGLMCMCINASALDSGLRLCRTEADANGIGMDAREIRLVVGGACELNPDPGAPAECGTDGAGLAVGVQVDI